TVPPFPPAPKKRNGPVPGEDWPVDESGAAGRIRTHDPLVRSFCHTAKLLIFQGLMPSVPIHFALF
ncbi:MAG: hypothetical protein AB7F93_10065, partial [Immundisolibacter sp.]|uniref:hypothetical protein n=1 Tax=Immundisolibacter sp. TaxID=1934948 RepID=UPI003D0D56C5